MIEIDLNVKLKSAATFGSGDGLAGVVDREIETDPDGFPFLRGKTLKGILAESAENIVYGLGLQQDVSWQAEKETLFGQPGRGNAEQGILYVTDAQLPDKFRQIMHIAAESNQVPISKRQMFEALTGIRHQTAVHPNGAPQLRSLRSMRVLQSGLVLTATLLFDIEALTDRQKGFMAATILDARHAGTGRNRGRGWIELTLQDDKTTQSWLNCLKEGIKT